MRFSLFRRLAGSLSLWALISAVPALGGRCDVLLDLAHVLDAPRSNGAQADDRWVPNAIEFVAQAPWPAEAKVTSLRLMFQEIRRRDRRSSLRWDFAEHRAGPTTVFVGGLGYFVEIRPDGSVYRGLLDLGVVEHRDFMSPNWNPPGTEDGLPPHYFDERWLVAPRPIE